MMIKSAGEIAAGVDFIATGMSCAPPPVPSF